jgi:DNA-binding LacI/PurR family transcriptional regulator
MATIQDVAKAADVAASTVSRYLNGQLKVTPATQARIVDAVASLGYVANYQAKNLARRRSGAIGFVVPDVSNPYFGTIADHVVEAVELRGLMVLLCSTRSQAVKESSYIDLLASGAIDGMLYLGSFRFNVRLAAAIHGGLPVVVVDEPIAGLPEVHSAVMDDYSGGYQAASYLVALGHRRIAFVSGQAELGSVVERRRGYCDALVKGGIDPDAQLNLPGHFTEQFGASALPRLLAGPEPPTAAFVTSDYIALGMLSAAETHGIRVPEDLSIVGFDDIRFSQYVRPRLTTIRSPVERLAQIGVEMLFERLNGTAGPARTEVLPVELIVRESAGPPPPALRSPALPRRLEGP